MKKRSTRRRTKAKAVPIAVVRIPLVRQSGETKESHVARLNREREKALAKDPKNLGGCTAFETEGEAGPQCGLPTALKVVYLVNGFPRATRACAVHIWRLAKFVSLIAERIRGGHAT